MNACTAVKASLEKILSVDLPKVKSMPRERGTVARYLPIARSPTVVRATKHCRAFIGDKKSLKLKPKSDLAYVLPLRRFQVLRAELALYPLAFKHKLL